MNYLNLKYFYMKGRGVKCASLLFVQYLDWNFWYYILSEIRLIVCFFFSLPAPLNCAGLLGNRGVGEGAEAEEPAVSKGGKVLPIFIIFC
jgi:hypothetical protein